MNLTFLDFIECLAVDTLSRGWPGFQSLDADFYTAGFAVAVVVLIDQVDSSINLSDQFAFPIAGP